MVMRVSFGAGVRLQTWQAPLITTGLLMQVQKIILR